ncbi:MAG: hypothetical protein KU38_01490 [Sulfurovum sp. FS08-3]|nr:MAG: hypothetical protein KU38_01490 [Sulfurovum sp. FS08-3]
MKKNLWTLLFLTLLSFGSQGGAKLAKETKDEALVENSLEVSKVIQLDIFEDKQLLLFIQEIKTSIATHNWSAFIDLCSSEHYKTQVNDSGMSATQYIAEAIGVHHQENTIFEEGESKIDMKVLEKIEDIKFLEIKKHYNEVKLQGIVILKNGKTLTMSIDVLYDTQDGYVITGALG